MDKTKIINLNLCDKRVLRMDLKTAVICCADRKEKKYMISIIIPCYNTSKYLEKCVNSLLCQSYQDFEIIIVDDGSTDDSAKIAERLQKNNPKVKLVSHNKNQGLFSARITGVEASRGEYITFVDADDTVSVDWLRLLTESILKENADIAVGQMIMDIEGKRYEFCNLDPMRQKLVLKDKQVFDCFFRQHGNYFTWHMVCAKLYRRSLWENFLAQARKFADTHPRFVMCEDQAFSTALWLRAKKVCTASHGAVYFYFKHAEASTSSVITREGYEKRLRDVSFAFAFMKEQLDIMRRGEEYADDLESWKVFYAQMYYADGKSLGKDFAVRCIEKYLKVDKNKYIEREEINFYFHNIVTSVEKPNFLQLEAIKKKICDPKIKVISFDVFDTLILRPFATPSDLFNLLNDIFVRLQGGISYMRFSDIRIESERLCRERLAATRCADEDITIDAVYDFIRGNYMVGQEAAEKIKEAELLTEEYFCYARECAKELYELARSQGKKIIACSDMYLPKQTVVNILAKNGYEIDTVYLSSEIKLCKHTGSLFRYVQKQMGVPSQSFLHIGDNEGSDVSRALECGWQAAWLPRAMERFKNETKGLYGGESVRGCMTCSGRQDMRAAQMYLGNRCAMAIAANKLFDDPFVEINRKTDFNADPYFIGYYALGQYLFAVTNWILQNAKDKGVQKIHFAARDGYLPMRAAEIAKQYDPSLPEMDYVYISRRAMVYADIAKAEDMLSLKTKLYGGHHSRKDLTEMFWPVFKAEFADWKDEKFCDFYQITNACYEKRFNTNEEFSMFVPQLSALIDYRKLSDYRERLKKYFGSVLGPNDLLFDIGYSGRSEAVLTGLLGYPVNSLYLHSNSDILNERERIYGFHTDTFYDYKPVITGIIREHVFMKLAPSVIGYENKGQDLIPVFGKYESNFATEFITEIMQNAALEFVRDMFKIYGEYLPRLAFRNADLAATFEYYLHFSKELDRKVFACLTFEDQFGLGKNVDALSLWEEERRNYGLRDFGAEELAAPAVACRRSFVRRVADLMLPYGTRRREIAKKIYHKLVR